jgi:transcriptional regulator with XRE-family HTH domain
MATPRTLKALLVLHNRSEVARAVGVNRGTLYRWETGQAIPSGDKLQALAKLLGIDANAIDLSAHQDVA